MRTVAQKMGIQKDSRAIFLNAPTEAIAAIELPELKTEETLSGNFDYIHYFATSQESLKKQFNILKEHLGMEGMLWVSWPKNRQLDTDLTLPEVIKIGYSFGLVESTTLSINNVWSALKFTHPKKGKLYKNSHAELQSRTTNR